MPNGDNRSIVMKDEGYYARVSKGPQAVIERCAPRMRAAINSLLFTHDGPRFTIADYGCADGGTSLGLLSDCVDHIREQRGELPIVVAYNDLPEADFRTLFRRLASDPYNWYQRHDNVYPVASGISFHHQAFPPASIDLGFSASAMHYLGTLPDTIEDHVHPLFASGATRERFRAVALEDWNRILRMRARELRPGGRLVMANFCVDAQGRHLGNTGGANLFDVYHQLWRGMFDEGLINETEYRDANFQQYYKTIDESLAPFREGEAHRAGLRLLDAKVEIVPCPFRTAWDHGELDRDAFAESFVATHRSWTEFVFAQALSPERAADERAALVETLYARYVERVKDEPDQHRKDLLHLYIEAEKSS